MYRSVESWSICLIDGTISCKWISCHLVNPIYDNVSPRISLIYTNTQPPSTFHPYISGTGVRSDQIEYHEWYQTYSLINRHMKTKFDKKIDRNLDLKSFERESTSDGINRLFQTRSESKKGVKEVHLRLQHIWEWWQNLRIVSWWHFDTFDTNHQNGETHKTIARSWYIHAKKGKADRSLPKNGRVSITLMSGRSEYFPPIIPRSCD